MKSIVLLALASTLSVALYAAEPKQEIQAAAKSLSQKANYSWTSTSEMPGSNFNMPPLEGKTDKDGFILVTREMNNNTSTAVIKGEKAVTKTEEGWKTAEELGQPQQGQRGGMGGRMLLRTKAPAVEVEGLLEKVKEIKAGDKGVYTADLTEAGVKELLTFGGRRPNANADQNRPEPKNAKGSVKIIVKDGVIFQYEINVQGTIVFGQEEREMNRITKVEIKDIGTTKLDIPEDAKKKLN